MEFHYIKNGNDYYTLYAHNIHTNHFLQKMICVRYVQ